MVDAETRVEQVGDCGVALVSIDPIGTIIGWSTCAEVLFGHDAAWMIGRSFTVLLADPITEERRARLRRVVEGKGPEHDTTRVVGAEGTPVLVDVTVVPVQSCDGSVDRIDLIMTPSDPASDPEARVRDLAARFHLNDRETDVIRLLSNGHRTPTIARELYLAPGTVRNTLSCIYAKVGVGSQVALIELIIGDRASGLESCSVPASRIP
jgi:PAS domain S-box-containing protein